MYLAMNPDRLCTVKEITNYYGISQNHLTKAVHNLSKLEYIQSSRGKGGGIQLMKDPDQINLRDLITKLEPSFVLVECFDESTNTCRISSTCGLKGILYESLQAFNNSLGNYSLADTICKMKM